MKILYPVVLIALLSSAVLADDVSPAPAAAANKSDANQVHAPGRAFPVSAGTISAPFVLTNDCISQPTQDSISTDGKATYTFAITNAGDYIIKGLVNAGDESANSFYVNIDADPQDPEMIWDVEVTSGFEERVVNWRGNGSAGSDEFDPKVFKLAPGTHKLIVVGREPDTQLKTITILPNPAASAKPADK